MPFDRKPKSRVRVSDDPDVQSLELMRRGVSSLKGYGQPSTIGEFLGGFTGAPRRFSVMDPEAAGMQTARDVGEQASVAGQMFGAMTPFAASAAAAKAGQMMGVSPLTVYHGTPHRFSKFDSSKIGTGEGAQMYGRGLYFAEHPKVAKRYARTESDYKRMTQGFEPKVEFAYDLFTQGLDEKQVLDKFISKYRNNISFDEAMNAINEAKKYVNAGYFYTVDLPDEKIVKMLDWDKPISKQKNVMDALRSEAEARVKAKLLPEIRNKIGSKNLPQQQSGNWMADLFGSGNTNIAINKQIDEQAAQELRKMDLSSLVSKEMDYMKPVDMTWEMTGKQLYELMSKMQGSPEKASAILKNQGIPGIRYLDEGSRAAGKGTSNFVVFPGEEEALTILDVKKKGGAVKSSSDMTGMNLFDILRTV